MQFWTLLRAAPGLIHAPNEAAEITAPVSEDTRTLQPGGVFVARRGLNTDSHRLIPDAVAIGAAGVVGEYPRDQVNCPVPYAQVENAQQALGYLAAAYHGYPSRQMTVIGVTGTDGKTTTASLLYSILKAAGLRAGIISTVSAVIGDQELPTGLHVTTPTAPEVQGYLRQMAEAGLTHCILETTSHGLAQGRVNGVDYDGAVITNITHEHLDFHGSFENYRAAKGRLFEFANNSHRKPFAEKFAVINRDDESAAFLAGLCPDVRQINYSLRGYGDWNLSATRMEPAGMALTLEMGEAGLSLALRTPLVGRYNLSNILAAVCAAYALDIDLAAIRTGILNMPPVPGRMERIDEGQAFTAIVDFAHTPNALLNALDAARGMTTGRVIAVFGSAGLRDREKRRLMAEVSAQHADISVFTAEDPRTEPLDAILAVMAEAAAAQGGLEGQTFYRVPDRGAALAFACGLAGPGDVVIACGKGHEQSMCFGQTEYPWDDRDALRAALRGRPLRTLPTATGA